MDQNFSDTPAINVGEASAHIFVGYNLKIIDVYKSKDNNGVEFLGALHAEIYRNWMYDTFYELLWLLTKKFQPI